MNPEDSKQEPTAPPEAWKQPEPTTLQPGRSMRSVYIVPSASKPSVSKPPAAKPSVSGPSVVKPSVSKPSVPKPLSVKPSVSKPPAAKPSESKSPAPKPVAPQQPKKAAASAPSEHLKPSQAEPSASKAPRGGPPKHAEPPELSKTAPQEEPAEHPVPRNLNEKVAIQKRAEGRAKVPSTFTDSLKHFCFSPTGLLKILRMILIIAAVVSFVVGQAHETFIAITIQEACIVLFFILIYMVTLQHLLVFLDWTLFDLINSFISAVFLLVVAVLTWQEKERRPLFYIGGVFCLTAAILCLIDALLVTKKMRNNMKVILGIKTTPSQAEEPKAKEPKAEEPKPQEPKSEEPKPQEPKPQEPKPQPPKPQPPKPQPSKPQPPKPQPSKPQPPKPQPPKPQPS